MTWPSHLQTVVQPSQPQQQVVYTQPQQPVGYAQPQQVVYTDPQQTTYNNDGQPQAGGDPLEECGGNPGCGVAACVCPCVVYGMNYSLAVEGKPDTAKCVAPCIAHAVADAAIAVLVPYCGYSFIAPLGCFLRLDHRVSMFDVNSPFVAKYGEENCLCSMLTEVFCWGCSLAQIHGRLERHNQEHRHAARPPFEARVGLLGLIDLPPSPTNTQW